MPDTPLGNRGLYYTTHLDLRCMEFHQCRRCQQCTKFNRHAAQCVACESNKPGMRHCTCTDAQQAAVAAMEEKVGRPMFDINAHAQDVTVEVMPTSFEPGNQQLLQQLGDLPVQELDN